jgi:L-ascorbate metabolism protein UlaG (beta-lactamase superfamily)
MRGALITATVVFSLAQSTPELNITLVGNAGVVLSDGATSLLLDLPYEPGAFGYMSYDPARLDPPGSVTSVLTHHHRDHFDASIFLTRDDWNVLGPPSVTDGIPKDRTIQGDSVRLGEFDVVTIPTPHTDDHRSYRIRWRGRVLHFVGDTEVPDHLRASPALDVLFVTPWFSCRASEAGLLGIATRSIAYHIDPDGGDRICGGVEEMTQGSSFTLTAGNS